MLDFFFLDAEVEELPCAEDELDCCGFGAATEAVLPAGMDIAPTLAARARSSDAVIGSLVILLRCNSLPGAMAEG